MRPGVRASSASVVAASSASAAACSSTWVACGAARAPTSCSTPIRRFEKKGPRCPCLLLGDGPDEGRYRARAVSIPGVVFAGFVQADAIAAHYALADAMVFPTLGDPHGLVVEEAMAAGLPVISSAAAGDIRRRLPEGTAGLIVPAGDSEGLGAAMRTLALDAPLRLRMGAKAQELAGARGHARYAEEFEAFALDVLGRPRRGGAPAAVARVAGHALALATRPDRPSAPLLAPRGWQPAANAKLSRDDL